MNNTVENTQNTDTPAATILAEDSNRAMQQMIRLSQKLVQIAETETQNLIQNDIFSFAVLQDEKEKIASSYAQASSEFRGRLNEFRNIDKIMIDRLDNLQKDLAQRSQSNNVMVERLYDRSRDNTTQTLLAAQEIAQGKCIKFPDRSDVEVAQNSQGEL